MPAWLHDLTTSIKTVSAVLLNVLLDSDEIGHHTDYGHPVKAYIKEIWKFGPMWQTKYASAVPKNLGLGFDFRPCSEGDFLTERP